LFGNVVHNPGNNYSASRVVAQRLVNGIASGDTDPVPNADGSTNDVIDAGVNLTGLPTTDNNIRGDTIPYRDRNYGFYKTQIGAGHMHYTFHNTGDAAMVVDYVVHKPKPNHAMGKGSNDTLAHAIADVYRENWKKKRDNERSGNLVKVDLDQDIRDQVLYDPKYKFLPTSLRLDKLDVATQGRDAGPVNMIGKRVINDPVFVDIKRGQFIVPPGRKKVFTLRLPAKSYVNTKCIYPALHDDSSLASTATTINEHGFNLMFSITGSKNTTVAVSDSTHSGPSIVGKHAAATSFRIYGKYVETVKPAALEDRVEDMDQRMTLKADVVNKEMKQFLRSAKYLDVTEREREGRFSLLGVEGQLTKKQRVDHAVFKKALDDAAKSDMLKTASIEAGWDLGTDGLTLEGVLVSGTTAIGSAVSSALTQANVTTSELLSTVASMFAFIVRHDAAEILKFLRAAESLTLGQAAAFCMGRMRSYLKTQLANEAKTYTTTAVFTTLESIGIEKVVNNLTMGFPIEFGGFAKDISYVLASGFIDFTHDKIDSAFARRLMTEANNELTLEKHAEDIEEDTMYPQIIITDRAWIMLNSLSGTVAGHSQELADAIIKFIAPIANNDPEDGSFGWTNGQLTAFTIGYATTDSITYSTTAVPAVLCQHSSQISSPIELIRGQHWYTA
jgi:hypothetical protein